MSTRVVSPERLTHPSTYRVEVLFSRGPLWLYGGCGKVTKNPDWLSHWATIPKLLSQPAARSFAGDMKGEGRLGVLRNPLSLSHHVCRTQFFTAQFIRLARQTADRPRRGAPDCYGHYLSMADLPHLCTYVLRLVRAGSDTTCRHYWYGGGYRELRVCGTVRPLSGTPPRATPFFHTINLRFTQCLPRTAHDHCAASSAQQEHSNCNGGPK